VKHRRIRLLPLSFRVKGFYSKMAAEAAQSPVAAQRPGLMAVAKLVASHADNRDLAPELRLDNAHALQFALNSLDDAPHLRLVHHNNDEEG